MGKIENMSAIIDRIKSRGLFQGVGRFQYLPFNLDYALELVEGIGKDRNPKFSIDNENRFTYENLIRWIHGDSEMQCLNPDTKEIIQGRLNSGIYIAGNTGSGKSWALEIMAAYTLIYNFQIQVGENKRCMYWSNFRTDTICDEYTSEGSFDKYKKMYIIGIQDLGAEPFESMHMGNRINVLKNLMEYRGDFSDKITLITSNLPMSHKALVDRYGDRVSSRLNEMCNYFEIKGKDRRKI